MSHEPAIRLVDAGKRYTKYEDTPMLATAALRFRAKSRQSALWALRHVDLEVADGDCFGVIGRNGSGKSTMLQLMAGITAPTEGSVAVRGRIAPLITVGVGFHPELTGRENVFVNGRILGMSRQQIEQRLEAVVEFAEIAGFLDTPVKFYSSGMMMRLGFAVAIHAEPQVLLVDEVLAVGDLAFQWKCFDRMMQHRTSGMTIAVVSHNLNAVRRLCEYTMVLDGGTVRFLGDTAEAVALYHELMEEDREFEDDDDLPVVQAASMSALELLTSDGRAASTVDSGDEVTFRVTALVERDIEEPVLGFAITSERGVAVYSETSLYQPLEAMKDGDELELCVRLRLPLVTGSYQAQIQLTDRELRTVLARVRPLYFYVAGRKMVHGIADLGARFEVNELGQSLPDHRTSAER